MIAEIMLANAATRSWTPRWYYVMLNKTTGLKYVGQTINLHKRNYCGSGQYWVLHCKKHGGHNRKNIEVLQEFWAETESDAKRWLDDFEKSNPEYFKTSNIEWANRAKETTEDSAFCGVTKEKRTEYARAGGLASSKIPGLMSRMAAKQGQANVESGHMKAIQKIGCSLGGKLNGAKNIRKFHGTPKALEVSKANGSRLFTKLHKEKNPDTGKSQFAINIGKASGVTRGLMKRFCQENGIQKPGVNYVNIDKEAFRKWRSSHDC
jgi:hypothetical protein